MATGDTSRYWWCLEHERVETDEGCANTERLGPFDSATEAAAALENAQRRTEAWETDPDWNDDVDD
jgi:hypothetical protein